MHTAKRAMRRLALVGWLGLLGTAMSAAPAHGRRAPERVLPDSTIFVFKINDAKKFREAFRGSHYGQLWNDPAMKDFRDDLGQKLEDAAKPLKEKIGVSLGELLELPQGPVTVAVVSRDDPKLPIAFAIMADAGDNKDKMADVLTKATKQAEEAGAKASQETFNGLTLHILRERPTTRPRRRSRRRATTRLPTCLAGLDPVGERLLLQRRHARQRGRGDQGPDRPPGGPRQLPGQQRVVQQDPGQDRIGQGPGRLVPRRRQGDQAGPQGQRQGQRGPDAAERGL